MPKPEPLYFTEKLISLKKHYSALKWDKLLNYVLFVRESLNLKIDTKIIKIGEKLTELLEF